MHHGSKVLNTRDFGTPHEYNMAGRFNAPHAPTDSIASGYLAGSARVFKLPEVPLRTATEDDIANHRAWKNYSVISTQFNYLHGMLLGKNHGIVGTIGNCFDIAFVGSTGSTTVARKFNFEVRKIGKFGVDPSVTAIQWTSAADRAAGSVISDQMMVALGNSNQFQFGFRILDWNSTGTKCIMAAYIQNEGAQDDDGTNQMHAWPFGFIEFTFSLSAGNVVSVSGTVVQRYLGTSSAAGNSFVSGAGAIILPGRMRKYSGQDGAVTPVSIGVAVTDSQVWSGPPSQAGGQIIFEGTIAYARLPAGTPPAGTQWVQRFTIPQDVGQARFVSGNTGTEQRMMRTLHMCYDKADALATVTMSYTRIVDPLVEVTKSLSITGTGNHTRKSPQAIYQGMDANGNHLWGAYATFVDSGSGTTTCTYVVQQERYTRNCLELRVNGELVDYLQVEHSTPTIETTRTIVVGYGTTVNVLSTETTENTSVPAMDEFSPPEGAIAGPLNWLGGYEPLRQAGSSAEHIRNTPVPLEQNLARLRPFARLETNKMVSFNLGDDDVSVAKEGVKATSSWEFYVNPLLVGNHVRRTVWDIHNGRKALNNVTGFGAGENPARDISGLHYHCTLNPISPDAESVINSPFPVTIVGNA